MKGKEPVQACRACGTPLSAHEASRSILCGDCEDELNILGGVYDGPAVEEAVDLGGPDDADFQRVVADTKKTKRSK